ncbi:MAG: glutathione S-transferase [Hyphomicrobium sp.]|nr:MAG: glutathione S-transferase [Hyphomicrobium sp.]
MKIIETRAAPNPRRVRIFLAEKGITVPFEEVDLMSGVLKQPAFGAKNPMQRVPLLMLDDGTAIAETVAICRYFEEKQPEPALFGSGAKGRAIVEMWNRRIEFGLLQAAAHALRHLNPKMAHLEVPQVPAWGEANKPKAIAMLGILDAQLKSNRFMAGDGYSIADITAMVAVDFLKPARIARPEALVHLERWYGEVSARPSAQA